MAALDLIEAIIAIVWLMVFVSSVIRGVSRGLRRAEEEAARRAGGRQVLCRSGRTTRRCLTRRWGCRPSGRRCPANLWGRWW